MTLPDNWHSWRDRVDLGTYDERWAQIAAEGGNPHGEADLVASFRPGSVLDGGCGTGRVGIELARRGITVLGVDPDPDMIAAARAKAPHLEWLRLGPTLFPRARFFVLGDDDIYLRFSHLQASRPSLPWSQAHVPNLQPHVPNL